MQYLRRLYAYATVLLVSAALAGVRVDSWSDDGEPWVAVGAVTLGCGLAASPAWKVLRHACTYVHELAHALTALLVGGVVYSVTYEPDASGLAKFSLPREFGRPRLVLAAGAGYLGPGMAGLGTVAAVRSGMTMPWLLGCAVLVLLGMLLLVRSLWGFVYSAAFGAALWMAGVILAAPWSTVLGGLLAGVMLGGGVRMARTQLRHRDHTDTDAGVVGKALHLPGSLIAVLHLIAAALLLVGGVWLAWDGAWLR